MDPGIYHEKQVKSLCALHALNNLLQDGNAFKKEDLDRICNELNPKALINPHKAWYGWGNYDINVIMKALEEKKLEAVWFDKRKDPFDELNFDNIYGILLNVPTNWKVAGVTLPYPFQGKHWVAIRGFKRTGANANDVYYNLDSSNDEPRLIGDVGHLIQYLRRVLQSSEKQVFVIVTQDIGNSQGWKKNPLPPSSAPTSPG